jgi:hypothetical protein
VESERDGEVDAARGIDEGLITQRNPHERRSHEARVLTDEVCANDGGDDHHQHGGDDHPRRVSHDFAQQQPEDGGARDAHEGAGADARQGLAREAVPARAARLHPMKHEHAEKRANRIDEHTFPLQEGTDVPRRTDEGEHREHYGRPGHNENRADQQRDVTTHVIEEQGDRDRDAEPGDEHTYGDEAYDNVADSVGNLAEGQPQPGLEQDDAHCQRHERLIQRTEQCVRMHVVGRNPGDKARREQHHDRREPKPERKQLRAHGKNEHEPEAEEYFVRRHTVLAPMLAEIAARSVAPMG